VTDESHPTPEEDPQPEPNAYEPPAAEDLSADDPIVTAPGFSF
jgi:hypothetical protein